MNPAVRNRLAVLVAFAAVAWAPAASAQELLCTVGLDRRSLAGNEYEFLDELRGQVRDYLNRRPWTEDVYGPDEQIECDVQITVRQAVSLTRFDADVVVSARRPVYGTAQRTTLFSVSDEEWEFDYTRGQALVYDPNRYNSLTSVLDFYANLILGYDYDSFSELGGTEYFRRARQTAELGRATLGAKGWGGDRNEDRSRYTLIQEVLDPTFEPLRRAGFTYHYRVLDHFLVEPEASWAEAVGVLGELHELFLLFNRRRYATDVFYGAKADEIVALLVDSPQRNEAYALLSEMDPARISVYDALVSGR